VGCELVVDGPNVVCIARNVHRRRVKNHGVYVLVDS
jgi:hypothetical protein